MAAKEMGAASRLIVSHRSGTEVVTEVLYPCGVFWLESTEAAAASRIRSGKRSQPYPGEPVERELQRTFDVHFCDVPRARARARTFLARQSRVAVLVPGELHPYGMVSEVRLIAPWWDLVVVAPDPGAYIRRACQLAGVVAWVDLEAVPGVVASLVRRHVRIIPRRKGAVRGHRATENRPIGGSA
jgi:hypothetical protein